ncbi:hypothetical protein KJ836_02815 [Patescibacteria group bacterium]|nr:hypothetical protein [Patescibacteria group bacterium]
MKRIDLKTYTKPTDFVKFPIGETKVILISEGGMVKKHGMKTATSYVPLGTCTEKPDCGWCLKGNEPKLKWLWIAFVNNEAKVLDVGPMIGDGICKQAQENNLSVFTNAIFSISRVGLQRSTKYEVKYIGQNKEELNTEAAKKLLVKKYFI